MTEIKEHIANTLRGAWLRFLFAMLLCALAGTAVAYALGMSQPVAVGTIQEDDGVAVVGHSLKLRVTVTRFRYCDRIVRRWMQRDTAEVDPRTGKPIPDIMPILFDQPGPPTPVGVTMTYLLTIPLPVDVVPGAWEYRSESRDRCGLFARFDRQPRTSGTSVMVEP